jgi:hypothetical protein
MKRNTSKKLTSVTLVLLLVTGDGIAIGISTAPEAGNLLYQFDALI